MKTFGAEEILHFNNIRGFYFVKLINECILLQEEEKSISIEANSLRGTETNVRGSNVTFETSVLPL
jgi:hypothetical protein